MLGNFFALDKSATLVIDKSGRRDVIELRYGKRAHRLFYEDLDSTFSPRSQLAFKASLNKVGKVSTSRVHERTLHITPVDSIY